MSKTSRKVRLGHPSFGRFAQGELLPWKGLWFRVVHAEEGVLVLALDGYSKQGLLALAELKAQYAKEQEDIAMINSVKQLESATKLG